MPRILSGKTDRVVGRPSPRVWSARTVQNVSNTTKQSVKRLFRRDPAKGILGPGGDAITNTHIDIVHPSPTTIKRDRSPAVNKNKTLVRNRGTNRSLDKR